MTFTPSEHIQTILKNLPMKPGVYLMKDEHGKIIYVGKAKKLRNRVRSYFNSSAENNLKTMQPAREHPRHRLHRRGERDQGADPRRNADQALPTALQHQPEGRQEVPLHPRRLARPVPEGRDDAARGQRRQPLLRSLRGDVGGAEHAANAAESLPLPDLRPRDHRQRPAPVPVLRHQAVQRALHRRGQSGAVPRHDSAS